MKSRIICLKEFVIHLTNNCSTVTICKTLKKVLGIQQFINKVYVIPTLRDLKPNGREIFKTRYSVISALMGAVEHISQVPTRDLSSRNSYHLESVIPLCWSKVIGPK